MFTLGLTLLLLCSSVAPQSVSGDEGRQAALALEQQGNLVEAEAAWRAWSGTHPADAEASAHMGLLEARQEHYKHDVRAEMAKANAPSRNRSGPGEQDVGRAPGRGSTHSPGVPAVSRRG